MLGRLRFSFPRSANRLLSVSSDKTRKGLEGKYSHTVHLPKNTFDQRANAIKREPEIQQFWKQNQIYENLFHTNKGPLYTLHDGPPYANGDLHIGHALNKILKDFVNKYQILNGRKVKYLPGWDCHGLPIELKVLQSLKKEELQKLSPIQLRNKAEHFVTETVARQRIGFQRYGVWGDWDQPYLTMQKEYEAAQISVFGAMVKKGLIYRGKKPVHWSPSSRTALAEAELEYPDNHISRSVYVGFDVVQPSSSLQQLLNSPTLSSSVRIAIWTTTPWTLPANQAVAVREDLEYSILANPFSHEGGRSGGCLIVATELVETFIQTIQGGGGGSTTGPSPVVLGKLTGGELSGTTYQHPLYSDRIHEVILGGDYINTESGTGLVHTAPGHGAEDYLVGLSKGLPLFSPVDDNGNFTSEAGESLVGKFVLGEGNTSVINSLTSTGHLLLEHAYRHKYPYDWRTKKPTIFRATEQWFASVDKPEYRQEVLTAIEEVKWVPEIGKNRIISTVISRKDWCISRQRIWGVPIPVFYHKETNEPLITEETIQHIEEIFRERGSNAWWELTTAELLPASLQSQADQYLCGKDTMDVWFDSGTSWAGVLWNNSPSSMTTGTPLFNFPADLYLEGSDQHRGWFQSSLLTSVAASASLRDLPISSSSSSSNRPLPTAPYKTVLTHGFVLDEKGFKMSKSLGNVLDPNIIIHGGSNAKVNPPYGADTLRLWVAGVDYTNDVSVGPNILKAVSDSYRKLRNTFRFLLGSLDDFNPHTDRIPLKQMPSLDRYMLGRLSLVFQQVDDAYATYQFSRATQLLTTFTNKILSNFYLDLSKDCLYISSLTETRRRSCQTVLIELLEQLIVMLSPIVPHLAEDVWQAYLSSHPTVTVKTSSSLPVREGISVFQRGWIRDHSHFPPHEEKKWELLTKLKDDVNYCLEMARREKCLGASQECQVKIYFPKPSSSPSSSSSSHTVDDKTNMTGSTTATAPTTASELFQLLVNQNEVQKESGEGDVHDLRIADDELKTILIVSKVSLITTDAVADLATPRGKFLLEASQSSSGLTLEVEKAQGQKCERCWFYCDTVGHSSNHHHDLCSRCDAIVRLGEKE
jgi:isoleucyl-tRNA synthetase